MVQTVDVDAYALDAGTLEMLEGSSWVALGATMENNVFRVRQEKFRPELNNVLGTIKGTERIISEVAEIECSIPELSAARMALMVPGVQVTISPITVKAGGTPTTLSAAALAGADQVVVASVGIAPNDLVVGNFIRIEAAGVTAEYRKINALAGTTLTLDRPLVRAHAAGASVTETDGDGRSTITGSGVRIPEAAYHDFRLRVDSNEGLYDFIIKNAVNIADAAEMTMSRAGQPAPRLTLQTRYDPANTKLRPWSMVTPGPDA